MGDCAYKIQNRGDIVKYTKDHLDDVDDDDDDVGDDDVDEGSEGLCLSRSAANQGPLYSFQTPNWAQDSFQIWTNPSCAVWATPCLTI